jgi:hypothetical protein
MSNAATRLPQRTRSANGRKLRSDRLKCVCGFAATGPFYRAS